MLSETQIIHHGLQAERLLDGEGVDELFDFLELEAAKAILNTKIEDADTRERAYTTINGMRYFVAGLRQLVMAKDEIVERQNRDEQGRDELF